MGSGRGVLPDAAADDEDLAIALAVFGFNLFGDALRDALDPRALR